MTASLIHGLAPLALWLSLNAHAAAPQAWPAPIQALEAQGYEVLSSFPGPAGLTGYAALYLGRPQTLYLTPDGLQAIVGNITDAHGENGDRSCWTGSSAPRCGGSWKPATG